MVMFIYRPEYYGITEDDQHNSTQGLAELIIAKHRNGSTEDVKIRFQDHLAKFVNWDNDNFEPNADFGASIEDNYGKQVLRSSKLDEIDDSDEEPPF